MKEFNYKSWVTTLLVLGVINTFTTVNALQTDTSGGMDNLNKTNINPCSSMTYPTVYEADSTYEGEVLVQTVYREYSYCIPSGEKVLISTYETLYFHNGFSDHDY